MEIIYLLSVMMLLIAIITVNKTEKEINVVSFICVSIVALFCYNTFVCYVLTFFTKPITLANLTVINIFFTVILLVKTLKNKAIQKYTFKKIDILYIFFIFVIVLIVSYINFGFPFDVKYETGDPSVHYLTSVMFAESDALLANSSEDYIYGSFNVRKTVSYVNSGLLMKCLCPNLEVIECYNVFVVFGILTLFLIGATIYSAMANLAKNKEHRFWAFLMAVICMLGYPLNSFLFGFEYLSMGLLIICAIINLAYYHKNDILDGQFFIIIMFLLNFGLFSAYYMFVPFMYPALWIYFCIQNYIKNKKIITKKLLIELILTLLIPFILGYIYHLAPEIYAVLINRGKESVNSGLASYILNSGLAVNGYIYTNLYSNILLLLPLPIYLLIKDIKEKKLKDNIFIVLAVIFNMAFIVLLLIGNINEKCSLYYLSKNYFTLWILLFYCNYRALIVLKETSNYFPRLFITAYIIIITIGIFFPDAQMKNTRARKISDVEESLISVTDIFEVNNDMLFLKKPLYNQEKLKLLTYAKENLDFSTKIEVVNDDTKWTYVLLRYINKEPSFEGKLYGERYLNYKIIRLFEQDLNDIDYAIYFKDTYVFDSIKEKLFENAEIIYENEAGGILKYN